MIIQNFSIWTVPGLHSCILVTELVCVIIIQLKRILCFFFFFFLLLFLGGYQKKLLAMLGLLLVPNKPFWGDHNFAWVFLCPPSSFSCFWQAPPESEWVVQGKCKFVTNKTKQVKRRSQEYCCTIFVCVNSTQPVKQFRLGGQSDANLLILITTTTGMKKQPLWNELPPGNQCSSFFFFLVANWGKFVMNSPPTHQSKWEEKLVSDRFLVVRFDGTRWRWGMGNWWQGPGFCMDHLIIILNKHVWLVKPGRSARTAATTTTNRRSKWSKSNSYLSVQQAVKENGDDEEEVTYSRAHNNTPVPLLCCLVDYFDLQLFAHCVCVPVPPLAQGVFHLRSLWALLLLGSSW